MLQTQVDMLTIEKEPKCAKPKKSKNNKKADRLRTDNLLSLLYYASLDIEYKDRNMQTGGSYGDDEDRNSGLKVLCSANGRFWLILELLKFNKEDTELRATGKMCYNILCQCTQADRAGWHSHTLQKGKKISFCDKCNTVYFKDEFCYWCH